MNKKIQVAALLFGSLVFTGCAVHEGHDKHVNNPTLGEELSDLQKAREAGAISEQEYLHLKNEMMDAKD